MSDTFTLDVRQAAELAHAFERNNWTNADIKKLSSGNQLAKLLPVVRGLAEVNQVTHVIDCDADPFVPEGWKVEEHKKGGQLSWDPAKLTFYLSKQQLLDSKCIVGNQIRQELVSQPTLNACLLDYLLDHPHLIPEEWKKDADGNTRYIFFWSTIYRRSGGNLFVRCLCWDDGLWLWGSRWLDFDFNSRRPALVGAS